MCSIFPKRYFFIASIFSHSQVSRLPFASFLDLSSHVVLAAVFPFFIPLAGCYSMPTTLPAFFFISIRVLRAICYDPTNPRE